MQTPTACIVIIGNEILSGRTQDKNVQWLAERLNSIGVRLQEVRIIPDVGAVIQETVKACAAAFTYVFTTGGIGPTHDDITAENIAQMMGVELVLDEDAKQLLVNHYGGEEHLNAARLKMAHIPDGAILIKNPVSGAPGFKIGNIYVMAGVPSIMQAMFDSIKHTLVGGEVMHSRTVSAYVTEGTIAESLTHIQEKFPNVEIGSYPFARDGKLGTSIVGRGTDTSILDACMRDVITLLALYGKVDVS